MSCEEELDLTSESLPLKSKIIVTDAHEDSLDVSSNICEFIVLEKVSSLVAEDKPNYDENTFQDSLLEASVQMTLEANVSDLKKLTASENTEFKDSEDTVGSIRNDKNLAMCKVSPTAACMVETITDPISSKLAAVHHVSLAIKSLRWIRQLQSIEPEMIDHGNQTHHRNSPSINLSVCACGDADCIEVCDIREWLPTSKLDHKLWKLILLLGESYLALGQAYKDNDQLHQALKVVQLACSIYGSMPQHLENTRFISSMACSSSSQEKSNDRSDYSGSSCGDALKMSSTFSGDDSLSFDQFPSTYLFWAKAWTLVGDVYVEFYIIKGKDTPRETDAKAFLRELKMSSEVVKEVKRLKKKLGQDKENCSSCSLINCSCQSDRASSGSSASSSSGNTRPLFYGRKQNKKSYAKSFSHSPFKKHEDDHDHSALELKKSSQSGCLPQTRDGVINIDASDMVTGKLQVKSLASTNSKRVEDTLEMHKTGSNMPAQYESAPSETTKVKNGGIFKYLGGPVVGDIDYNLTAALGCYEEARKALGGFPCDCTELQSAIKKLGWVCNELGRNRLERKELDKAELAFADAINAFKKLSDHTNIILIYCNLGHGRRALAEEMLSKIENLKKHAIFHAAYNQALETVKLEYSESLRFYGAAKSELNAIGEEACFVSSSMRNEVYTQFAHTYLRLGMFLAREDTFAEIYENVTLKNASVGFTSSSERRSKKELRKKEISANDAIREALSIYESLGELRKQEAAYTYFQLACYQRDSCLKFLEPNHAERNLSNGEKNYHRVKQYSSLAERNWQKAIDFYGPKTHPTMYLTILMERAELSSILSSSVHSNAVCS